MNRFNVNCEWSWRTVGGKNPFPHADEEEKLNVQILDEELARAHSGFASFDLPANQVFILPQHFNRELLEAEYPWIISRMRAGEWFEYGHRSEILCLGGRIEDQLTIATESIDIIVSQQMRRIVSAMFFPTCENANKIAAAQLIINDLNPEKVRWNFFEQFHPNTYSLSTGNFLSSELNLPDGKDGRFTFRLSWPIRRSSNSISSTASIGSIPNGASECVKDFIKGKLQEWEFIQLLEWFFCCIYEANKLRKSHHSNYLDDEDNQTKNKNAPCIEDNFADFGYPGGCFANQLFVAAVRVQPLLHQILARPLSFEQLTKLQDSRTSVGMVRLIPTAVVDIIYSYHQLTCPSPFDYVK